MFRHGRTHGQSNPQATSRFAASAIGRRVRDLAQRAAPPA
jgi:hypothetical protein